MNILGVKDMKVMYDAWTGHTFIYAVVWRSEKEDFSKTSV
jgi:hypothetical protein